jgi:hypothetical protein
MAKVLKTDATYADLCAVPEDFVVEIRAATGFAPNRDRARARRALRMTSQRCSSVAPAANVAVSAQHHAQLLDEPIELAALDDQRRREPDDLLVRVLGEHAELCEPLTESTRRAGGRADLDADE